MRWFGDGGRLSIVVTVAISEPRGVFGSVPVPVVLFRTTEPMGFHFGLDEVEASVSEVIDQEVSRDFCKEVAGFVVEFEG